MYIPFFSIRGNLTQNNSSSVDNDKAKKILEQEWKNILEEDKEEYVNDYKIRQKIREILNASLLTYKYILVTSILAKVINPNIHYRSMQARSDLEGAYNARSLAHEVLVPWEKEHGERLGGSNEPYLNKPARHPEFSLEVPTRNTDARKRLHNLLERLQTKTEKGEVKPINVLRQTLQVISELEPTVVDFQAPESKAPFLKVEGKILEYLEKSGEGERLASVVASLMETLYTYTSPNSGWNIKAEHANSPDKFSKAAGDVEIYYEDELVKAIEAKDKPTKRSDIQHIITKAKENNLSEYLYVVGAGFADGEQSKVVTEIRKASINVHLLHPKDLLTILKLVNDEGRVSFLESVGDYLNKMRASSRNKAKWKELLKEIKED